MGLLFLNNATGSMGLKGQWDNYTLGDNLLMREFAYDSYNLPQSIKTKKIITGQYIQNLGYLFNDSTGNLTWRKDNLRSLTEAFVYDELNRLEEIRLNGTLTNTITYDNAKTGNIESTTLAGAYKYEGIKPHAVTKLDNANPGYPGQSQTISYTNFNKVSAINNAVGSVSIIYGPHNQRVKMSKSVSGVNSTAYYDGEYEEHIKGIETRKLHYIAGGDGLCAIYEIKNGTGKMHYVLTDHLGSYDKIYNDGGTLVEEYSFDPWGRRRNPTNWTYTGTWTYNFTSRGFTSHEHLDGFDVINMNGRCYDPNIGRFLSPDNYVQMPDFTQNFNRYAYCLNNPLIYTDPSGEFIFTALLAPIGLAPLGVVIDGACWSAAIDAGIQGIRIAFGQQQQFNWSELGGAAVGGAVFAGMGLIAPSFSVTSTSFMTNLPKYAGKAGYAALTGAVSTGAGMFASDMFDNGQIDYSDEDYLKAMGTAGLISGGVSFASSMLDYATWDRLSTTEKIDKLKAKFDGDVRYNASLSAKGQYTPGNTYIEIGPAGLTSKGQAYYTASHELKHLGDWNKYQAGNLRIPTSRAFRNHFEIRAHKYSMRRYSTSYELWIDRYDLIRGRGAYSGGGYGYKGFVFSFGIDQMWNFFY